MRSMLWVKRIIFCYEVRSANSPLFNKKICQAGYELMWSPHRLVQAPAKGELSDRFPTNPPDAVFVAAAKYFERTDLFRVLNMDTNAGTSIIVTDMDDL